MHDTEAIKYLASHSLSHMVTRDHDGWTPAHVASYYGRTEVLILMAKVSPSVLGIQTSDGRTPRDLAQTPVCSQLIGCLEKLVSDSGIVGRGQLSYGESESEINDLFSSLNTNTGAGQNGHKPASVRENEDARRGGERRERRNSKDVGAGKGADSSADRASETRADDGEGGEGGTKGGNEQNRSRSQINQRSDLKRSGSHILKDSDRQGGGSGGGEKKERRERRASKEENRTGEVGQGEEGGDEAVTWKQDVTTKEQEGKWKLLLQVFPARSSPPSPLFCCISPSGGGLTSGRGRRRAPL